MDEISLRLRQSGGAISRRANADVTGTLDRLLRKGLLVAILPGVYCAAGDHERFDVRVRAASLWAGPDAVITGLAAAKLTFWPECHVDTITLSVGDSKRRHQSGVAVSRRHIPPDLVVAQGSLRCTAPSLTALDLADGLQGSNVITRALRSRTATLDEMWDCLSRQTCRIGNPRRAALLHDLRTMPWSEAERVLHRLLRRRKIRGWSSNVEVRASGHRYFPDVLFPASMVVIEVDGWEVHGTKKAFESDRTRRNHLVMAGYQVLNFTWQHLTDQPDWVIACVRTTLGR